MIAPATNGRPSDSTVSILSSVLLSDVANSLATAEPLKSFPEFTALVVLKALFDMDQTPELDITLWHLIRNRLVLGLGPAQSMESEHLANQYFKNKGTERYVGFLNCGRGRVRYQLYGKDPNNHNRIVLLKDTPGHSEAGAELDKLKCGSYQPEVAVEAETLKHQLEEEMKYAPWAELAEPIDVYCFVTGRIRDEAEFRILDMALAELVPHSVKPITALLGPGQFGPRSYLMSARIEGKCQIEGARFVYEMQQAYQEPRKKLSPVASLKMGLETAQFTQYQAEPFIFLDTTGIGPRIVKRYRRNPVQFQALCEMIRTLDDVPTIVLQPPWRPEFKEACRALLGPERIWDLS